MKALIVKYLSNEISDEEIQQLYQWLQKPKNQEIFATYVKTNQDVRLQKTDIDVDENLRKVILDIDATKQRRLNPSWKTLYKYAALIVIGLTIGYFAIIQNIKSESVVIPKMEAITLQLENGTTRIITPEQPNEILDSEGNIIAVEESNGLSYTQYTKTKSLVYNTLHVPFGKKLEVTLSDGTKVHLNSGSSLEFPVAFLPHGKRKVFLTGEAYFDVVKNSKQPFEVVASDLEVTVLGTKFNVSSYKEDKTIDVVLVEGSVALTSKSEQTVLKPGQKGSLHNLENESDINVSNVNTGLYTAWMQERLIFRDMPFEVIMKKLERQYNVTIEVEDELLKKEAFSGALEHENIETVLSYFKDLYHMEYYIKDNKIFINAPKKQSL